MRHITFELLKLLVVTTGVLVLVLSFAACVKFLADGKLSPGDIPRFMGYVTLPMLAYALPFASCFAATLVYHRLATDNEAQAAAAGGVSHKALLLPAIAVGIALAVTLGVLNEQVIPRFWRSMQRLITLDVARMLVNSVKSGESIAIGNRWVYAEQALPIESQDGAERFALHKAVIVEFGAEHEPKSQATAEWVQVKLSRSDAKPGSDSAAMTRVDCVATQVIGREGDRAMVESGKFEFVDFYPDAFEDDPKFLTMAELRELRGRPERINFIDRRRRKVAVETARLRAVDELQVQAASTGTIELVEQGTGRRVTITTKGLISGGGEAPGVYRVAPAGGSGVISIFRSAVQDGQTTGVASGGLGSGGDMRVETRELRLRASPADELSGTALLFRLEMPEAKMFAITEGTETEQGVRRDWVLPGLMPKAATLEELLKLGVPATITAAEAAAKGTKGDPRAVAGAVDDLKWKEQNLQNEVTSKQHERLSQAVCCLLMIVAGAVVALKLSVKQPLTVYVWSFAPALLCYITIAGGQQTTHDRGAVGLILLWAGVVGLGLYTLGSYRTVAKH